LRYKEDFTIFPRTLNSGKIVWYYQTYNNDGKRTTARSTGQKTKTAARAYCQRLLKEGSLVPSKVPTFQEYTENWFIYDKCLYIKGRLARGKTFSRTYADIQRGNLKKYLWPYFGKKKLDKITPGEIEKWLFSFIDLGLSRKTANNNLNTFSVILNEAERLGVLKENPIQKVAPLTKESKPKGILSLDEIKSLFSSMSTWDNEFLFTANILAASTGLRLGEVQALRYENVHENYIHVCYSYERNGYGLKETKTGKTRDIPIPPRVSELLLSLRKYHTEGYVFSYDKGQTPIYFKTITQGLYKAMVNIGIDDEQRKIRNITFHSWRHFFNTTLRSQGVIDSKVQSLTGHSSKAMTNHYTHFQVEDYSEILDIQGIITEIDAVK